MACNAFRGKQGPIPSYGGKVTTVHNMQEWNYIQFMAIQTGERILVDCYANWCPPCRTAAPIFAAMSTEYSCKFVKVDVDSAADVARELSITAMPTFLLFGNPAPGCPHMNKLGSCTGWRESEIRKMLESNGIARCEPEDVEDEDDFEERDDAESGEKSRLVSSGSPEAASSAAARA